MFNWVRFVQLRCLGCSIRVAKLQMNVYLCLCLYLYIFVFVFVSVSVSMFASVFVEAEVVCECRGCQQTGE